MTDEAIADAPPPTAEPARRAALPLAERAELARALRDRAFESGSKLFELEATRRGFDAKGPLAVAEWLAGPVRWSNGLRGLTASLARVAAEPAPRASEMFVWHRRVAVHLETPSFVARTLHRGLTSFAVLGESVTMRTEARFAGASAEPGASFTASVDGDLVGSLLAATQRVLVRGDDARLSSKDPTVIALLETLLAPLVEKGLVRLDAGALEEAPTSTTPILVAPYLFSKGDLELIAKSVALELAVARPDARPLLVTSKAWEQRELFLALLTKELEASAPRVDGAEAPPPRLLASASASSPREQDPSGVLVEVALVPEHGAHASIAPDAAAFLDQAVQLVNGLPGREGLACIVAPSGLDDDDPLEAAILRAELELTRRTVSFNVAPLIARALGGVAPLEHVQKIVLRGGLAPVPRALHLARSPRALELARGLARGQSGALGLFAARA